MSTWTVGIAAATSVVALSPMRTLMEPIMEVIATAREETSRQISVFAARV
jgi:hypothetical protein